MLKKIDYQLAFNDEFKLPILDTTKWSHRYLGARKLGVTTAEAVSIVGGHLRITTYKDQTTGKIYTGMIGTEAKFDSRYGYFEARVRFPRATGMQAAFWLQSATYGQTIGDPEHSGIEVDIEYIYKEPQKLHFTTHWDGYEADTKKNYGYLQSPSLSDGDWHTIGIWWREETEGVGNIGVYEFYVDGNMVHKKNKPISAAMQYIIVSCEVTEWAAPVDEAALPTYFDVDYVRVYQKREEV